MRFEYLIGIRYLRARRRERFVSLIAVISLTGVTLGTLALTVALAVMSGFQEDLRSRLLAFTPEVTVERRDGAVWNPAQLRQSITAMEPVAAVAPFITSPVMAVSNTPTGAPGYVSGGILRGVEAEHNPVLTELQQTLQSGTLASLDAEHPVQIVEQGKKRQVDLPGAIVGKTLAFDLGLQVGDSVILISPASLAGGLGAPRLKRFVITGYFYSGMYDFDSTLVFVALRNGRALLSDDSELQSGLEVKLKNMFDAPAVAAAIEKVAGKDYTVSDWTRANAPLFSALQLEKFTYFMVLLLIVLVAAFNILCDAGDDRDGAAQGDCDSARDGHADEIDLPDFPVRRGGARNRRHGAWRGGRISGLLGDWPLPSHPSAGRSVHGQRGSGAAVSDEFFRGRGSLDRAMHRGGDISGVARLFAVSGRGYSL